MSAPSLLWMSDTIVQGDELRICANIYLKVPLPNPLLRGEGTSIMKLMQLQNQMMLPLPMGEGWGSYLIVDV